MKRMFKRRLSFGRYMSRSRRDQQSSETTSSSASDSREEVELETEWEMRPCGMLVQKRSSESCNNNKAFHVPNLNIRVVYGAVQYQISVNSQSTFGELKKLLTVETGLQPVEQRLIFRGKERENGEYLDTCGVKDRSKMTVIEDPHSREKRMIEMRRNEKILAVHRFIDDVSGEVDKLEEQVCWIEKSISSGKRVAELQITTLIEMLMRQAVKLDSIPALSRDDGSDHACAKKDLQEKKVQKCVETLDVLKVLNAKQKVQPASTVVVTTKWETFDLPTSTTKWELFD